MPSTFTAINDIPLTQSGVLNPPSYAQYSCVMDGSSDLTFDVPTNARWWIVGLSKSDNLPATLSFKSGSSVIHNLVCASGDKVGFPVGHGVLFAGRVNEDLVISSDAVTEFVLSVFMDDYPPLY